MIKLNKEGCGILCAALLCLSGLITIAWISFIEPRVVTADVFTDPLPQATPTPIYISGVPVRLSIERLGIDLPVTAGSYNTNTGNWRLDDFHLFTNTYTHSGTFSTDPSTAPLLIYGHNYSSLLGKTTDLVPGDRLALVTAENVRVDLRYSREAIYHPTDDSILRYQGPERLLLLTCIGTWDEQRRVMFFELIPEGV